MAKSKEETSKRSNELTPFQGAAFLFGVTGAAALGGFGMMFARARKHNPEEFHSGIAPNTNHESGARLALRALGRATLYSVTGFTLFCFGVWKLMGVKNMKEFSEKMQSFMPRISPENPINEEIDWDEIFRGKSDRSSSKSKLNIETVDSDQ